MSPLHPIDRIMREDLDDRIQAQDEYRAERARLAREENEPRRGGRTPQIPRGRPALPPQANVDE